MTLKHGLKRIFSVTILPGMLAYIPSRFGFETKSNIAAKKILLIDLQTVNNAYCTSKAYIDAIIRADWNIGNSLTWHNAVFAFMEALKTKQLVQSTDQWINRSKIDEVLVEKKITILFLANKIDERKDRLYQVCYMVS